MKRATKRKNQRVPRRAAAQVNRSDKPRLAATGLLALPLEQGRLLLASLQRLLQTPFTSAMAIVVMAIAVALAGSFYVLVHNAQHLVDSLQAGNQISLFLREHVSDKQAEQVAQRLFKNSYIAEMGLLPKDQALLEFKQYSGFGAALDALDSNPLPAVIQVTPLASITEPAQLNLLVQQLQSDPDVEYAQVDMSWIARLQSMMQMIGRLVWLLSGLLALAVVLVTGNTIRLELQSRRDEVVVQKLVGATNLFICVPFLYSGFWFGFLSGFLAWLTVACLFLLISTPVETLAALYQSSFQLRFLTIAESLGLLLMTSSLGVMGALAIVSYQLRLLKPE